MGRPLRARSPYPGTSAAHPLNQLGQCSVPQYQEKMYVFGHGNHGKVGGATAEHLLAHGKQVRALVRHREKALSWADRGVELVDGDWNDPPAIARALKGVEGAFVMLPAVWAPSPDYKEAKGVIANYVEALTRAAPPRVVALSSMGANRTSGIGMITALSLLEQGFRDLVLPIAFVRAGGFFENFLYGLQAAQGGTLPVYYNPTNRKSTMVATNDIGAEVVTLLTGPAWSGRRIVELGSMVSADEVAEQLGEVLNRDVKAFAVPRAGWAKHSSSSASRRATPVPPKKCLRP